MRGLRDEHLRTSDPPRDGKEVTYYTYQQSEERLRAVEDFISAELDENKSDDRGLQLRETLNVCRELRRAWKETDELQAALTRHNAYSKQRFLEILNNLKNFGMADILRLIKSIENNGSHSAHVSLHVWQNRWSDDE